MFAVSKSKEIRKVTRKLNGVKKGDRTALLPLVTCEVGDFNISTPEPYLHYLFSDILNLNLNSKVWDIGHSDGSLLYTALQYCDGKMLLCFPLMSIDVYGTETPKVFQHQIGKLESSIPKDFNLTVDSVEAYITESYPVRRVIKPPVRIPVAPKESNLDTSHISGSSTGSDDSEYPGGTINQDNVLSFIREGNLNKKGNLELAEIWT